MRVLDWLCLLAVACPAPAMAEPDPSALAEQAYALFKGSPTARRTALEALAASGRPDVAPILILSLRFVSGDPTAILTALEKLTGATPGRNWDSWMKWQEAHPETGAIRGFAKLQKKVYALIDPNFDIFLDPEGKHEIRREEIVWGGVVKDGIPALTNPKLVSATAATYMQDTDLVFGVEINGDVRAYPLRIMDWHEMLNEVIGGVPVSLAYCTLCGSGILFETTVPGRAQPFVFGSSGFLYRSNKLMYDKETHSLWNQFTGRPVVGTLTGSDIALKTRPVVIGAWGDWKARHADTKVLALETGHDRDYATGAAYHDYFASPRLMFPTNVDATRLRPKDYVFALRSSALEKAWPLALFDRGAVINDRAGVLDLVLIGNSATRTVRAYRSEGRTFKAGAKPDDVNDGAEIWQVTEDALVGPGGKTLSRLPGHIAYAFAWTGYFGQSGELATDADVLHPK